jgi:hypothetical protein
LFHPSGGDETNLRATKPFFVLGAELRKRRMVIKVATTTAESQRAATGDSYMRTLSIILAFAFVLAGASVAGYADGGLPGVGTFVYSGSPIATSTPQAMMVAAR